MVAALFTVMRFVLLICLRFFFSNIFFLLHTSATTFTHLDIHLVSWQRLIKEFDQTEQPGREPIR